MDRLICERLDFISLKNKSNFAKDNEKKHLHKSNLVELEEMLFSNLKLWDTLWVCNHNVFHLNVVATLLSVAQYYNRGFSLPIP